MWRLEKDIECVLILAALLFERRFNHCQTRWPENPAFTCLYPAMLG